MRRVRSRSTVGSLSTKIEMKMMLSMPSTSSSAPTGLRSGCVVLTRCRARRVLQTASDERLS
jgi:hypothetical protein